MTDIRPLRNEADYDAALKAIEPYFLHEPRPGSREADRFDLLALVIADYEARHWAIEAPDAPDILRAEMKRRGLKQADLGIRVGIEGASVGGAQSSPASDAAAGVETSCGMADTAGGAHPSLPAAPGQAPDARSPRSAA